MGRFSRVYGVPTGGERLAEALRQYSDTISTVNLVVDDVFTTGKSMQEFVASLDVPRNTLRCFVLFSRHPDPQIEAKTATSSTIWNLPVSSLFKVSS